MDILSAEVGHCLSTIPQDSKERDGFIQQKSLQELVWNVFLSHIYGLNVHKRVVYLEISTMAIYSPHFMFIYFSYFSSLQFKNTSEILEHHHSGVFI